MPARRGFECRNCHKSVKYAAWGTKNRNHCPYCLFSLHVDLNRGDRMSPCGGLMKPVGKIQRPDGEEMLVHKCEFCGIVRKNRIAGDDLAEIVEILPLMDYF
ncbi:hypothetical protein A3F07_02865 [candidate division WWE3 bacterium RIFCSPHIGHO2_12_FULL_38_15]|uniref:RNHCP domain-containing protein n=1 Tax=candidate division WWE3 bacterium RIFCSPHIGHO2_02_FULL_38_14 TaxID=1802620 RepID=A0A1F4V9U9_UNCKA|nr:MAG: hypothetical protein A2793_04490 [candidate division WWE3 bacterium RIFCSPHIGHO2_01_FULL_38_45]OGC49352.1 MAG: hypothetical protein A3F07_02865 [candidate division WWE3 bacterium RIFCSPHIGHO2_12_FULL_38_15]OGC53955.1 MAG: hypothetical protein A3B64_02970 [candidate division WWE3 bacterium RIFCSPLOWO2_01_FULL_37_24]OGC54031.1 MAG: hypothetical protein A3D91_04705 [candidate division WWE3 bacterium RIFCSPHIGHO2_02_FULL_38_14]HLB51456.1 RNHCP domain-containing protein [Patescibacteria grou